MITGMHVRLAAWNELGPEAAAASILPCCGSEAWARELAAHRPIATPEQLLRSSCNIWFALPPAAWKQAFCSHPRLGERNAVHSATAQSLAWSAGEQSVAAATSSGAIARRLAEANQEYEQRFGRVFLLCASGRTSAEILDAIHARMGNDSKTELRIAGEEQSRITSLRLRRWLDEGATS